MFAFEEDMEYIFNSVIDHCLHLHRTNGKIKSGKMFANELRTREGKQRP